MNNFNIQNKNMINIYDCFNYDRKLNIIAGYCTYCKMICDFCIQSYLVTGPEILIILLKREKEIEFDIKIIFEEYLNLYNYIEYKNTGFNYKLIGVIEHIGNNNMNDNFVAYCRDPITEKWDRYNDIIVTEVKDYQKEVINCTMPYILFYQKIN